MLETKRYIGNDLNRLYARIRREIGEDAIIVRTRSLLREDAEPLVEILATSDDGSLGLPNELQRSMLDSVLSRVSPSLTVGDLEDLVQRENLSRGAAPIAYSYSEPETEPEYEPGPGDDFSEADLLDQLVAEIERRGIEHPAPLRERLTQPQEPAPAPGSLSEANLRRTLSVAGFSQDVVAAIAGAAAPGDGAAHAVATTALRGRLAYPEEDQTAVISVQGVARSGRTVALLRMAQDCAAAGRPTVLVAAADVPSEVSAYFRQFCAANGIRFTHGRDLAAIGRQAKRAEPGTCFFIDCPSGVWRMPLPVGVRHFRYLAVPSVCDRDQLRAILSPFEPAAMSGIVPTFVEATDTYAPVLDTAISLGLGIAFLSAGDDPTSGIEVADLFTLASGSLPTTTGVTADGRLSAIA